MPTRTKGRQRASSNRQGAPPDNVRLLQTDAGERQVITDKGITELPATSVPNEVLERTAQEYENHGREVMVLTRDGVLREGIYWRELHDQTGAPVHEVQFDGPNGPSVVRLAMEEQIEFIQTPEEAAEADPQEGGQIAATSPEQLESLQRDEETEQDAAPADDTGDTLAHERGDLDDLDAGAGVEANEAEQVELVARERIQTLHAMIAANKTDADMLLHLVDTTGMHENEALELISRVVYAEDAPARDLDAVRQRYDELEKRRRSTGLNSNEHEEQRRLKALLDQAAEDEQANLPEQTQQALAEAQMKVLRDKVTGILQAAGGRLPMADSQFNALADEYGQERLAQAISEVASVKGGKVTLPGTPPPDGAALSDDAAQPIEHRAGDRRMTPDGIEHTVKSVVGRFVGSECGDTFLPPRNVAKVGDCEKCSPPAPDGMIRAHGKLWRITGPLEKDGMYALEMSKADADGPWVAGKQRYMTPELARTAIDAYERPAVQPQRAGQSTTPDVQQTGGRKATTPPPAPKAKSQASTGGKAATSKGSGAYEVLPVEGGFSVKGTAGADKDQVRAEVFTLQEDAQWWGKRLSNLSKVTGDLYMPKVGEKEGDYAIRSAGEGTEQTAWLEKNGQQVGPIFHTGTNAKVDAMRFAQRLSRPGRAA